MPCGRTYGLIARAASRTPDAFWCSLHREEEWRTQRPVDSDSGRGLR
jgi:hypothetical protein